ncbi:MAG: hypothetical protein M3M99_02475, partial [Actinomycetota bacterium]|nr:hypothetical protein [Actinomycetota bacterium]
DDDERSSVDLSALSDEFQGSACRQLAGIAAGLAAQQPPPTPQRFLRDLGRHVAGIRPPPRGYGDLARGGYNLVPGRGFLARFDDETAGQARHFAGIAVASTLGGGNSTRVISIFVRNDREDSPDGRLTDEGILFAREVLSGELELDESPVWLLTHLCRRSPG